MKEQKQTPPVVIFGAAENGPLRKGILCSTVQELYASFGSPPEESFGLLYAIQSVLCGWETIYFRVLEEGLFSEEYAQGFQLLETALLQQEKGFYSFSALCLPGVGIKDIIDRGTALCCEFHSILVLRPEDLYDFLTEK